MAITATFETGSDGATISTGDAGSATAWNAVSIVASGTCAYDNDHVYDALAAKIATGATSGVSYMEWTTPFGTQTNHYGRVYLYFTANPGAGRQFMHGLRTSGSVNCFFARVNTAGTISLLDTGGTVQATSSASISLNQWVRFEYHVIHSTTVGQIEGKLFNSPDSASETETFATAATINTRPDSTSIRFGLTGSQSNVVAYWLDNIVAADTAYPGPAALTGSLLLPNPNLSVIRR